MFVYPLSYKMSKDKMEIAVLLRGKVYDIRIQNTTALLFICEVSQKILFRYANFRKYPHKCHKKTLFHYIIQSTKIKNKMKTRYKILSDNIESSFMLIYTI